MTEAQQTIDALLAAKAQAQNEQEKSKAHIELLRYHYFLPEGDRASVAEVMKPILDKLNKVPMPPDPLLQRAQELLNRIKARVPQS